MKKLLGALGALALIALAALAGGCSAVTFDPSSKVETVRILATSADKPYAAPGDTVHMQVLAFDGRPMPAAPMNVYWGSERVHQSSGRRLLRLLPARAGLPTPHGSRAVSRPRHGFFFPDAHDGYLVARRQRRR
jgi:hypothetical protein